MDSDYKDWHFSSEEIQYKGEAKSTWNPGRLADFQYKQLTGCTLTLFRHFWHLTFFMQGHRMEVKLRAPETLADWQIFNINSWPAVHRHFSDIFDISHFSCKVIEVKLRAPERRADCPGQGSPQCPPSWRWNRRHARDSAPPHCSTRLKINK